MVAEGGARTPRVGAAVRRRRRALDLTLAEVAARSGLSSPFLSQIENDRARPGMRSLQRIADALDTTAVRLLAASDESRTVDLVRADDASGLRGDALGRVRHRWRTTAPGTRVLVVAVADHMEVLGP
ncbi:helix-turn-helix domain-containing protein [Streptomyces fradiae]|uniref:helix-turn-helix domain-containing protein n=1 Tax=Streptomyces fradiae TaxID=1906 RepID=UPI0035181B0A